MAEIGSIIDGKYNILKEIGKGGMSVVYLAIDVRLNRPWAIKEIKKHGIGKHNEIIINSLLAEANLMKQFDHPALPRIVDLFDDGTSIYVVMDYIEGESLERVLQEYGPQPEELVIEWAKQLVNALSYLHNQRPPIIYRDMKPANIMLQPDGKIKIIDFGIAREYKKESVADTTILGTKGFAPPEQYIGQTDPRSDIFALGMTLHYLLTGADPRSGEIYLPVRQWNSQLSEGIEAIIDKCVQPALENRYQNCKELLYALENLEQLSSKEIKKSKRGFFQIFTFGAKRKNPSKQKTAVLDNISDDGLTDIVFDQLLLNSTKNPNIICKYTKRCELFSLNRSNWSKIRHLHILGDDNSDMIRKFRVAGMGNGGYITQSGTWLLIIGANSEQIQSYAARCAEALKILNIRYTHSTVLKLGHLIGLNTLRLSNNRELKHLDGLEKLIRLENLDLSNTSVSTLLDLNELTQLRKINISNTRISDIVLNHPQNNLKWICADNTRVTNTAFLWQLSGLERLSLSHCPVDNLSPLEHLIELEDIDVSYTKITFLPRLARLERLEQLNCAWTPIVTLDDMELPASLKSLDLSYTQLRRIPNCIRQLKELRSLYLNGLKLEELPNWLPEVGKHFEADPLATVLLVGFEDGATVHLGSTQVAGMDMRILSQPDEMILQWFEERKRVEDEAEREDYETPLNEIKVVFLGDGESGKSLTVARLLKDGASPDNFDGNATPGIAIEDRQYELGGRKIQVHFWDFGGQEILHSMHRMFLTQRTLYVIFINARDDTQDDRARYWLHNVKSFADGAPVLLVLNKIDQNPNASVNESDLRAMYSGLTEVVRMSALKFSEHEFNNTFTTALLRQIGLFKTLESPFLPSWKRLKNRLRNMTEPYIRSPQYEQMSEQCGVDSDKKLRKALLNWFTDLGISFCYCGSAKLEDYVILRPDWITNAIYILLFNKIDGMKNGIVSHEAIHRMLHPPLDVQVGIKRVLPDMMYSVQDTEYVLNVVRRFRLSYLVQDNMEFIPMLCQRDAMPVSADYAADPKTLEFWMVYEYLPNNVIHRLMVDMHRDLDMDNVWLTGARFAQKSTGLSAVVKSEGNILRLFVRSMDLRHPADFYLDIIKDALEQINQDMGLSVMENQVVYKADGIAESFDYDELVGSLSYGIQTCYSKQRKRVVQIQDILRQTDHSVDADREKLIVDIVSVCQQMQANQLYWNVSENARNTYVRDTLRAMRYHVSDQSLSGISASGKLPGELDLDIRKEPGIPWTIFEGLNLKGKGATQIEYLDNHLRKLLDAYNANGLPFLLLVGYVNCPKNRFREICSTYISHMKDFNPGTYTLQSISGISTFAEGYGLNHFTKMMKCIYDCGGFPTVVYHTFVRLGE